MRATFVLCPPLGVTGAFNNGRPATPNDLTPMGHFGQVALMHVGLTEDRPQATGWDVFTTATPEVHRGHRESNILGKGK